MRQVTATARAMEALVAEMDRKRQSARGGGGAVADAEDEVGSSRLDCLVWL